MIYFYYCLFIFFSFFQVSVHAEEASAAKKTICLNMIVKNEKKVITRCLASVKPIIDYWVIVDTGSDDETIQLIKDFLKDVPGEVYEKPWVNFAHNRNEALELAKGKADYLLLMDADDILEFDADFKLPTEDIDCYNSIIMLSALQYDRPLLIKNSLDWKWYGVLHEYLSTGKNISSIRMKGVKRISSPDGCRSQDPHKYQNDAKVLENALKDDPTNSRYVFYLAQSYKDCGEYASSLKNYEKRASMGGWDQEVFYSKLQAARMKELLEMSPEVVIAAYYDAYHSRPSRVEPLYYLARYFRDQQDFQKGYLVSSIGASIPMSDDVLFVEKWIYDYNIELECSVNAYWSNKFEESHKLCQKILAKTNIPEDVRKLVQANLAFTNDKLIEKIKVEAKLQ